MAISQAAVSSNLLLGTPATDYITGLENTDSLLGEQNSTNLTDKENLSSKIGDQDNIIRATQSSEILTGTENNELIVGVSGNNTIIGGLGDDTVIGGNANDIVFGGQVLEGNTGITNNELYGAEGNDTIYGMDGDDLISGNQGFDVLFGNQGNDTIYGGQGNDTIFGGQDDDLLFGDKGNDVLWGDLGTDTLTGGSGDDVFVIGRRNDVAGFLSTGGSTIAQADVITDFGDGLDLIALTGGLTFDDLNIFQGSGAFAPNTIIQDKATGEYLANLQEIDFNTITKANFTYSTISINNYLSFDRPTYSVTEEGTPGLAVTINRTGEINQPVSATLFASDGTAQSPTDYNSNPISVDFAAGQISKTVTIPIVGDNIAEGEETFDLSLGFPFNGATIEQPQTATVTIADNDNGDFVSAEDPGTIQFSSPTFAVNEDGTPIAAVTLNRIGGSAGAISTKVLLNGGTAIGGAPPLATPVDYDNSSITIEWEDGDIAPKLVNVPLFDNDKIDGNKTVNLTLCDCTGDATIGEQNTAALTIVDNDGLSLVNPEFDLLVDGTAIKDQTGKVDFGSAAVGDELIQTFTIKNSSPSDYLLLKAWELPEGFSLIGTIPGKIAPESEATFTLAVDTRKVANPEGTILIKTNAQNGTPFKFDVSAAIEDPSFAPGDKQIQIFANGNEIADGSSSAIDFGAVNLGETLSKTFTIKNPSSEELSLSNFKLPQGFEIESEIPDSIAPNSEQTFTLTVDTSKATNYQGTFTFNINDNQTNPFDFVIKATVNEEAETPTETGADIQVLDEGIYNLTDGSPIPVDFGKANIGETLTKTFSIRNTSSEEALKITNLTLPEGFHIEEELPDSLAPNSEQTFTLTVDTSTAATYEGDIVFETNDIDENPFNFVIKAAVNEASAVQEGASISDPSAPVEIFGSNSPDKIQGDDNGVDIITPRGGADIITWTNVPPQGITDQIIGFVPTQDKLQFAVANFGGISSITPVTVTELLADGTDISGNNLIIFDDSLSFADLDEADLALAEQNGTSDFPAFFVYSAGKEKYLGYDPIVNSAGDATNIAKFDVAPTAESFTFFN